MKMPLEGKTVAILLTDGFEQIEMTEPRKALDEAGARTVLIAPKTGSVQGMKHHDKGGSFIVDVVLSEAKASDYDALVLPGGVANPDALRAIPAVQAFVRDIYAAGKTVAAICHGPWTLIDAGIVRGKTMTSWPSLRTDLTNAGAKWVDEVAVVDDGIVTSRKPDDIPMFNEKMIEEIANGPRSRKLRAATRRVGDG